MNKIVQLPDDYNGILLVGEAPGADELSSIRYNEKFGCYVGKPFIGAEGKYLRQCCRQVSFPIEQCAIINTVHEKPFKNAYETLSADAISFGREQLIETINSLKPKLIVAIGGKALEMLTDYRGINKYRGTIVKSSLVEGYRVFSTIHPGFIFKGNPQFDIVLKMDLTKALREFHSPSPDAEMNINVIYDACEARKALYDLCFHQTPVTVDIETGGPKLLAFGVATSKTEAIVIPKDLCKDVSVLKAISEFSNSNVPKIYHNALYDVFYMAYYYKIFTRNIFADTMLAQHAIFPTLQKSLAFCASIYTNNVYWKEEGKEAIKDYSMKKIIDWPAFYIYNGKDCCVTYEVFEKQQEELDYWKTRPTYDLMMRSVPFALVSMLNGFHINHENVKTFSEINEKTIEVLEKIKLGCIGDVNFASPKQVCELIYDKWRLPERKNKGSRTSDDKALSYLATLPTNVQHFMGLIQTTREHLKMRGFYNIKTDPDGKMRLSQKIHGTKTGRWATSECITGSGHNMQNIPSAARIFYDAPPGEVFLEWDLSNVDARFVAAICEDQDWLNSFDIIDQHSFTAVNIFKLQPFYDKISTLSLETTALQSFANENEDFLVAMYKKVRENYSGGKSYRDYAKKIGHANHYLEQAPKLSVTLGCSKKEAEKLLENYNLLRPKLKKWHDRVRSECSQTRIIRTCFGRVIQFFGPYFNDRLPEAVATEPQSSAGDYLMTGGLNCLEQINEITFALQVHDSIMVSVKNDLEILKKVIPKIKEIAEFDVTVRGQTFKIPVEFKMGLNWGSMKKVTLNNIEKVFEEINK